MAIGVRSLACLYISIMAGWSAEYYTGRAGLWLCKLPFFDLNIVLTPESELGEGAGMPVGTPSLDELWFKVSRLWHCLSMLLKPRVSDTLAEDDDTL